MNAPYCGRFAPSPTGPLHFGSLITALVSYFHARQQGGRWLVRMEDLDPPREMPGAATLILKQLERHGFDWDGEVMYQNTRQRRYQEILADLLASGAAYYCTCSRKDIQAMGGRYDGRCRLSRNKEPGHGAIRLQVPESDQVSYDDIFQGRQCHYPGREMGDYVIRRRDGLYAYQLAVVVDDMDQGISHVLRGMDLQDATPRQILLFKHLGAAVPVYGHIPIAINKFRQKLSKQNHAASLDLRRPAENLKSALRWLGVAEIPDTEQPEALIRHGLHHWQSEYLQGKESLPSPVEYE